MNLSGPQISITHEDIKVIGNEQENKVFNTPFPLAPSQHYKAWSLMHKGKQLDQIVRDEALPSLAKVCEVRDSPATPPQTVLQSCQLILNKVLPDRIESSNLSMSVDINRLFEYWTALNSQAHATQPAITNDNEVIDACITNE